MFSRTLTTYYMTFSAYAKYIIPVSRVNHNTFKHAMPSCTRHAILGRDEHNHLKAWGTHRGVTHYYMELNAPKWKETVAQGNVRPAFFGDVVIQDNIGSPINKGLANFDDRSNDRFKDWLSRRCATSSCHPSLATVLHNASFNIRDHIALVRANRDAHAKHITTRHVAMEACESTRAPHQNVRLTPDVLGQIKFDGLCLTSRGAKSTNPGDTVAQACSSQHDPNQLWTLEDGMVRSARTDCAGRSPCCLSIAGGRTASGTALQLCGCSQLAHGCAGIDPTKAGLAMHLSVPSPSTHTTNLVSNVSGLCVTSSVETNISVPTHDADHLVREPVLHEFIRHGYISALQNWDDIAASVRSSQHERRFPAIWGNQYGLSGGFPISTLMTQTSDVSWIEGVHSSGGALTYKIADASGDFTKIIFGDDYGKGPSEHFSASRSLRRPLLTPRAND